MGTRVSYPVEVKLKAIEMRLAGVPVKEVMETLQIRNYTQLKTWMRWHRNGESYRLEQPVGQTIYPSKRGLILKILHQSYKLKIDI